MGKVFRTYNASKTLQEQLDATTEEGRTVAEQVLTYNQANRAVAILCNHKRTAPKTFDDQMKRADEKIEDKEKRTTETAGRSARQAQLRQAGQGRKQGNSARDV